MKIFVINLKKSVDRRRHMQKQLYDLGLNYQFVDAVDGRVLSDAELEERADLARYMQHPSWEMRGRGIIGCALSHKKIYEMIVENEIPRALILEDDIFIENALPKLLEAIDERMDIDARELILFETESPNGPVKFSSMHQRTLVEPYALMYPVESKELWLASAYSISYESAKAFLDAYPKVERVADVWEAFYEKGIFSTISCVTPFVTYQGIFDSSIGSYVGGITMKYRVKQLIKRYFPQLYLKLVKIKSAQKNSQTKRFEIVDRVSSIDPRRDDNA